MYLQDMTTLDGIGATCLGHHARMASRAVTRVFDARMREIGLRITQFAVLVAVARGEDVSVAAMAKRLDLEPSTLLRNIDVLEKRNLIVGTGGRGRRGRRFNLSEDGRTMLDKAVPVWERVQKDLYEALAGCADETRAALIRLEAAAHALERD